MRLRYAVIAGVCTAIGASLGSPIIRRGECVINTASKLREIKADVKQIRRDVNVHIPNLIRSLGSQVNREHGFQNAALGELRIFVITLCQFHDRPDCSGAF